MYVHAPARIGECPSKKGNARKSCFVQCMPFIHSQQLTSQAPTTNNGVPCNYDITKIISVYNLKRENSRAFFFFFFFSDYKYFIFIRDGPCSSSKRSLVTEQKAQGRRS
jgi:hypothetical protein